MPRFGFLCSLYVALSAFSYLSPVSAYALSTRLSESSDSLRLRGRSHSTPRSDNSRTKNIVAIYMNMPDRPERREFAEAQFRTLGLRAVRVEGTALPNKKVGPSYTWLRALDVCAKQPEAFCLLSEDDAVYRPVDHEDDKRGLGQLDEASDDQLSGLTDDAVSTDRSDEDANVTANPPRFFDELNLTLASLPGGVNGLWDGLHLCAAGELGSVSYFDVGQRFEGWPWPQEKFTQHLLYSGAPGVLLLRRASAKLYHSKLQSLMEREQAKHLEHPMDVLQPMLYSGEDAAVARDPNCNNLLKVFVAARPQLCQHLADMTSDPRYGSSRPEFESR
mmetsp:Transcript_107980/g.170606  ORF Transcript_107980/g.170606 Transcript_107980/m.170606 type:complete len:333 (-) Transcript_107980:62-1060(-)